MSHSGSSFVVELRDVDKDFILAKGLSTRDGSAQRLHALSRVSLRLTPGEFVFLTGPSGAGKSTLLRLVLGLENATSGEVFTLGHAIHKLSESKRRIIRRNIGVVFQDHKLITGLNVRENIEFPLFFSKLSRRETRRRLDEILEVVQMRDHRNSPVSILSAGEQQRVAIARALITCPSLVIADEPTGNLDPKSARSLIRLMRELKGHGTTVLIATHDMGLVRDFGGRVLELVGGALPSQQNKVNDRKAYKVPRFWRSVETR